ncbi:hypothetical protein ACGFZQ_01575 [Streptomyces sp. NPDC048254]|uniref:hypothetical protein n=1 Tax=Streptomyces sp. NPDC048254 TaxID=3365525 RepID=UPI00371ED9F9
MLHHIARLIEPLLRLVWPASGHHRHAAGGGVSRTPVPASPVAPSRRPSPHETPLRGEDSRLIRPYLLAHEQCEQVRQRPARGRALWLAVHGVDVGPRRIHGVDVGSRRIHGIEAAAA